MNLRELARPRILCNVALDRATRLGLWSRLKIQSALGLTHEYQPDPFAPATIEGGQARACRDRFEAMDACLEPAVPLSVLDLGCNRGYFTFRLAERGGLCIGIDADRNEIMFARAQAVLHRVPNAVFAEMTVDAAAAAGLPSVDVVVCLSIFHHWVRYYGLDAAREIMQALANGTRRYMVFETGQSEERDAAWADALAFMGADSRIWVRAFLRDLGFDTVHEAGPFPTTVSDVPRTLYIAEKVTS